jgi:uncharacterized protein YeaO (DUF488 family)
MTISTKRIHDEADANDGTRILIVREEYIAHMIKCPYHEIRKELAPSTGLYSRYYTNIKSHEWTDREWNDYSTKFIEEMKMLKSYDTIMELRERSKTENITLLCYCKNEGHRSEVFG